MDSKEFIYASFTELSQLIDKQQISPVELTKAYLNRIASLEDRLHAFITVDAEGALAADGAVRGPRAKQRAGQQRVRAVRGRHRDMRRRIGELDAGL